MARRQPGSGKGEKVRVFVDSAALCEDVPRMRQEPVLTAEEAEEFYLRRRLSLSKLARKKGVPPDLLRRDLVPLGITVRPDEQPANSFHYDATGEELLEALALGIWLGEGTRAGGNRAEVSNCDPAVLGVWLEYLLRVCHADPAKIRMACILYDPNLVEEATVYWEAELGMSLPCRFRFKRNRDGVAKRPMGTIRLYFNSTCLHRYIQQRAAELTETLVRAHQQPGDRLARQTPPGARPNKGAGPARSATTPG
jgi:hypothetical protein